MGRPKKEMPPSKGRKFTIRLTDVMYESLKQDALKAGLSVSEYARELLLDHKPVMKQEIVFDSEELLHVLGRKRLTEKFVSGLHPSNRYGQRRKNSRLSKISSMRISPMSAPSTGSFRPLPTM